MIIISLKVYFALQTDSIHEFIVPSKFSCRFFLELVCDFLLGTFLKCRAFLRFIHLF